MQDPRACRSCAGIRQGRQVKQFHVVYFHDVGFCKGLSHGCRVLQQFRDVDPILQQSFPVVAQGVRCVVQVHSQDGLVGCHGLAVVMIDHLQHIAVGITNGIADIVQMRGAQLAVDVLVLSFTGDRIHGNDPAYRGDLALANNIRRRLDEGIQQTVVAV